MSVLHQLKEELESSDWVTEQMYFSNASSDLARKLRILSDEGYIKHTPLLLYLSNMLLKRLGLNSVENVKPEVLKEECVSIVHVARMEGAQEEESTEFGTKLESPSVKGKNQKPWCTTNPKNSNFRLEDLQDAIEVLQELVSKFGSTQGYTNKYLAKKMLHESGIHKSTLVGNLECLESELHSVVSSLNKMKRKRTRPKHRKRKKKNISKC